MPTQTTFYGASIINFSCNLGWGQQSSTLTADLVVDPQNGDSFVEPLVGEPAYFEYEHFTFGGIVKNWRYRESMSGKIYTIELVDPRDMLANTQLIIGHYNGSVAGLPNLVNCYGYLENTDGFYQSNTNETGMPWNKILEALTEIFAGGVTAYGTKIAFRGTNYLVSLSGMPTVSDDYRIGGTAVSLLDAIFQVCEDCGYDFYVSLVRSGLNNVITVNGVSRVTQGNTNLIGDFVDSVVGANTKERGVELRNERTSTFLVGGPLHLLHAVSGEYTNGGSSLLYHNVSGVGSIGSG
jgi:hypothetical protein